MAKVLFISDSESKKKKIQSILTKNAHEYLSSDDEVMIMDIVSVENPDILILDIDCKSIDIKQIYRQIRSAGENILTILLVNEEKIEPELLKGANAFLAEPISEQILLATISSNLRMKSSLEMLSSSNQELARSLYQLNVLYDTSSQFAGSLDKNKLIDVMLEGMDKSLSFALSCTLTFQEDNEPLLIINSLYQISDRLMEALKLRTILNYKSIFDKKELPFELNFENLKIEKHIKHAMKEYDFSILQYDNMFAPISLGDNFFGFVEIYRENEFSTEDATCFQTLAQQVSLPLKSALLYQIKEKTNKKLAKLERLKSEFISIVSHELRTPLTAIKNSLDITLSGKSGTLTDTMEKFLSMAKRNVTRLSGIINDLLDLSKIEAGKMDFKFAITKIEPVIEYVKTTLSGVAQEKNLTISLALEENLAYIYADSHRLEQVLTNLVSNAIKFTPEGGNIEISSSVSNAKDLKYEECFEEDMENLKGNYLVICVKDEGIGIEKKDLKHVFDKFAQIENSLSRQVGGSGLGLPIAKQLLDAHNGTIWCDSEVGVGSNFYFALPLAGDRSNFWLVHKQLVQKANANNTTLATITLKGQNEIIESLINEHNLINQNYLNNSLLERENDMTVLTFEIPDGDKFAADFLKKKVETFVNENNSDKKYDIMYSYEIYPEGV